MKRILILSKSSKGGLWIKTFSKWFLNCKEIEFDYLGPFNANLDYNFFSSVIIVSDRKELIRNLFRITRRNEYYMIISWFLITTLLARLIVSRKTKITSIIVGPLHLKFKALKMADLLTFYFHGNSRIIATSKFIEAHYSCFIPKRDLYQIYAPIDLSLDRKRTEAFEPIKLQCGKKTKIGMMSYIYAPKMFDRRGVKNHEFFIDFCQELSSRDSRFEFFVVGGLLYEDDKWYLNKLKKRAKGLKVNWIDNVDNLGVYFKEMDYFIFPSLYENLGGVYEAFNFKCRTFSSDKAALRELVIDGITAFTLDLNSAANSAEKFLDVFETDKYGKEMLEKAYLHVNNIFDTNRIMNEFRKAILE